MPIAEVGVIAAVVLTALTILGKLFNGFSWIAHKIRGWKHRNDPEPFPVRLICEDADEFHPSSGFREGLRIEVHNDLDVPVQIKGVGLELTMQGQGSWQRHESVGGHPHSSFPKWLRPKESFEGYIDTEALSNEVYMDGEDAYWSGTCTYVDVGGWGKTTVDPKDASRSGVS